MHGEMSAGDIRTSHPEDNANEAGSQQLTPKGSVESPSLDKRRAVAEIQLGALRATFVDSDCLISHESEAPITCCFGFRHPDSRRVPHVSKHSVAPRCEELGPVSARPQRLILPDSRARRGGDATAPTWSPCDFSVRVLREEVRAKRRPQVCPPTVGGPGHSRCSPGKAQPVEMNLRPNYRAALDAGTRVCFHFWRHGPGASEKV